MFFWYKKLKIGYELKKNSEKSVEKKNKLISSHVFQKTAKFYPDTGGGGFRNYSNSQLKIILVNKFVKKLDKKKQTI